MDLSHITSDFYYAASPIFILCLGALVSLMNGAYVRSSDGGPKYSLFSECVTYLTLVGALAAQIIFNQNAAPSSYMFGSFVTDGLASLATTLILSISLVCCILFSSTIYRTIFYRGELGSLFLMVICGMLMMSATNELISLFIGLEIASIGLYALLGYIAPSRKSLEGAVKYLILGSVASAILMFGLALLYASTGSMVISDMMKHLASIGKHPWAQLGMLLTLVGLGFKLALVPFHLWAPDAYQSAPTGLTAFMATAVKVMTLVVMLRFLGDGLVGAQLGATTMLAGLAILSAVFGNILAVVQSSVKRMLAYSSIANAGYLAMALGSLSGENAPDAQTAVLFYLVTYSVITLGAFGMIMSLESREDMDIQVEDLSGLAKKQPLTAGALAIFMFAFAGIPPTAGFMSKFFVINVALKAHLTYVVLFALLGSMISLYYYLRIIVRMYMKDEVPGTLPLATAKPVMLRFVVAAALVTTIVVGTIGPQQLLNTVAKTTIKPAQIGLRK